jgi:hypothetical protein
MDDPPLGSLSSIKSDIDREKLKNRLRQDCAVPKKGTPDQEEPLLDSKKQVCFLKLSTITNPKYHLET